jgi:hypothetical protein
VKISAHSSRKAWFCEVKHLSARVLQNQKNEQNSHPHRRDGEEVRGHDFSNVVLQECLPGLRRWPFHGLQDARNSPFRQRNAKFEQLAVDAGRQSSSAMARKNGRI